MATKKALIFFIFSASLFIITLVCIHTNDKSVNTYRNILVDTYKFINKGKDEQNQFTSLTGSFNFGSSNTSNTPLHVESIDSTNSNILSSSFQKMNLTIFTLIGIEGTGHHMFQQIIAKISTISKSDNLNIITGTHKNKTYKSKYQFLHFIDCKNLNVADINNMMDFALNITNYNLLFFVTPFLSYPCGINPYKTRHMPNLIKLYDLMKNYNNTILSEKYNIYLRYIVTKRNFVETIVSACYRFGYCEGRVHAHYKSVVLIDKLLKTITKKYWIMIDYRDLLLRSNEYLNILSMWLNINNINLIKYGLSVIDSSKAYNNTYALQQAWDKVESWDDGTYIKPNGKRWRKQNLSFNLKDAILNTIYSLEMNKSYHTIWR
eukprot:255056_1